ncbi:hypothetical protein [Streptomyces sp. NPDC001250]|uniref:hypothetical protein n=1 Tax=unclassified Streptomyces TaxID=2593676 RepID=UPI0033281D8C
MEHRHRRLRPPMGWNSWDCYGTTVTEDEVLANAVFLQDRLLPHGWDTGAVGIQWYAPAAWARPDAEALTCVAGYPAPTSLHHWPFA